MMRGVRPTGARQARRIGLAAVACLLGAASPAVMPSTATAAAQPSGIGNAAPLWIAVSPAYMKTGSVVAVASDLNGCRSSCAHLWVTHDGGSTWRRSPGSWSGYRPTIAVDGSGHEALYDVNGTSGLLRSDDFGATWSTVGGSGNPAVAPTYARDHTVAVAGARDYVLRDGKSQPVTGSNGAMSDASWMFAPTFPSSGQQPPVLLGGSNASAPQVSRCDVSYACGTPVPLPAPGTMAGTPLLLPSSDFANDGTVFAQTAQGIYKSGDGGRSFAPIQLPTMGAQTVATPMLAVSATYQERGTDRHAYVAVLEIKGSGQTQSAAGGIFGTADGGATWSPVASPSQFDYGATAVAIAPDGRLFGGYDGQFGGGLLCNSDGKTWQASCPPVGTTSAQGNGSSTRATQTAGACTAGCAVAAAPSSGASTPPSVVVQTSSSATGADGGVTPTASAGRDSATGGKSLWVYVIGGGLLALAAVGLLLRRRSAHTA